MLSALRVLQERGLKKLGIIANLMLSVLLAVCAVDLIQAVTEDEPYSLEAFPSIEYSQPEFGARSVDISQLVDQDIFGQGQLSLKRAKPLDKAPDSQAKLVLRGIIFSDNPGDAQAIIAKHNGKDTAYHQGALLPGGIRLVQIQRDRVLISRNGRLETLRYKKPARQARQLHSARTRQHHSERIGSS